MYNKITNVRLSGTHREIINSLTNSSDSKSVAITSTISAVHAYKLRFNEAIKIFPKCTLYLIVYAPYDRKFEGGLRGHMN